MLVVAGTSVFFVVQREELKDGREAAARHEEEDAHGSVRGWGGNKIRQTSHERPRVATREREDDDLSNVRQRLVKPSVHAGLAVEVPANHPRRAELLQQADAVETDAKRRLGLMTDQLDLTDAQQEKIFPLLVRSSQSYDPGMRIVLGSHASALPSSDSTPLDRSSERDLVQQELSGAQEDALIERRIGEQLIWEEIIGDLTRELDRATPGEIADASPEPEPERATTGGGMDSDPAAGTPPASDGGETETETPDSRGGRNLFDEIDPGN